MADPKKGRYYKVTWSGTDVPGIASFSRTTNSGEIETSDFDSGNHKEFIPDDMDHTFSLEFQLEPGDTNQEAAFSDWETQAVDTLTFEPSGTAVSGDRTWSASAFATSVSDSYERNATVMVSVSFRISGEPTITVTP